MAKVVFDIETVGQDFELLDETSQEYFLRFAETDEKKEEARNSLSFYPLTAQIVSIGMLEVESEKGYVFFQDPVNGLKKFEEGTITYISGTEKEILTLFWNQMKNYSHFITFNGRVFDCPFLMLRSAINQLRASKNLCPYRYSCAPHIDLADQLSFYESLKRKFSLHMWCKAFGIESPKDQAGMTGLEVKDYFKQGKHLEIARYCLSDIQATKKLFFYWDQFLKYENKF